VIERRLQRAFALLSDTGARRISDVASDAGFSDIAPFYRLCRAPFRRHPERHPGRRARQRLCRTKLVGTARCRGGQRTRHGSA
jgi:AraC-like DNA-binding protein